MSRVTLRACIIALTLITSLPSKALTQDTKFRAYNADPIVISSQIRLALQHEQRAMELIADAAASPEKMALTKATVYEAYVLVRFAVGGVRQAQSKRKFPDPTLPTQIELMEKARADLRQCLTDLERVGTGQVNRLEHARGYLESSITTLDSVTVYLP